MAAKLGAVVHMRNATRLVAKQSPRSLLTRQFTCTTVRAKEVANQDELPNLRHAQRPRMFWMFFSVMRYADMSWQLVESYMRQL